jgi:hypothetical protein
MGKTRRAVQFEDGRKTLGMLSKLTDRRGFPVIRAQHRAQIEQLRSADAF